MGFPQSWTFPIIFSDTTYDYTYELGAGNHNFFEKGYRKRLVMPNKVIVKSYPTHTDQYSGYATDLESYAALGRYIESGPHYIRATSNSQCDDIAKAILQRIQAEAERGHGIVPMNVGQEVMDYVRIVDSISGDTRRGNVSYIRRQYTEGKKFQTEIRLGALAGGYPFMSDMITEDNYVTWEAWGEILNYIDQKDADIINLILGGGLDGQLILNNSITLTDKIYGDLDDISDGSTYGKVLATSISAGQIILAQATGDLDDIADGSTYAKTLSSGLSSGLALLSAAVGDLDDISDGSTYGKVLATSISAGQIILAQATGDLDDIAEGSNYGKVLATSISAGQIILAQATGDLDDIAEGSNYGKVLLTDLSAGHIKLTSGTVIDGEWYDESGVEIDASHGINIYGTANALTTRATKTGTIQCYVGADGKIYAGAGAVVLSSTGITIKGEYLTFQTSGGLYPKKIWKDTSTGDLTTDAHLSILSIFPKDAGRYCGNATNEWASVYSQDYTMKEITTPTAVTNWGKIYTKNDNKLYFQDGAGNEHEVALIP